MAPTQSKPVAGSAAASARTIQALRAVISQSTSTYLRHRTTISRAVYITLFVALIARARNAVTDHRAASAREAKERASKSGTTAAAPGDEDGKQVKVGLNREFLRSLGRLLRIVLPGWRTKEAGLLFGHSFFLVARSLISLKVAAMDGAIVKALVKGNGREFLMRIMWWMAIAVPATFTNSMLAYHQAELALHCRARLTQHIQDQYLSKLTFYGIAALDDRIKNADQLIAVDVTKFSNSLTELYGDLAKPMLDMIIYTVSLSRSVGGEGVVFMALLVQLSSAFMRAVTPPFGKYAADQNRLEGEFRFQHSRLIDYAEEVALFAGQAAEKDTLDKGYFTLIKHVNYLIRRRLYHGIMEDYVIKYIWGAMGLLLCSVPVFFKIPGQAVMNMGDRTGSFVTNRRMLMSASDAFGRITASYKEIMQLAGYTSRVSSLLDVMTDIRDSNYSKKLVSSSGTESNAAVLKGRGKVIESTDIKFIDVPIISPNGDVLVPALSFTLKQGDHLLVVGPNGCGKSSLFRILGGLWPVYGGTVHKPPFSDIFYIPQRPYLARGSLRQQIIYPDSPARMREKGVTDADLTKILHKLSLENLLEVPEQQRLQLLQQQQPSPAQPQLPGTTAAAAGPVGTGWDAEAEWRDILSGGVQQRIAMARLFYHRPRYAILDECTSSVTLDSEKIMYDTAKALGITLMTVSHRRSLWKYHTHILQFDGQGKYVFTRLDAERRLKLEDEKEELEVMLRSMPDVERRIKELEASAE